MQPYADAEIDDAIARIAADVERRFERPEIGPAMRALVDQLQRMEAARRSGDLTGAQAFAVNARPVLVQYRPTNSTSRAKAVLAEIVGSLAPDETDSSAL